MTPEEAASAQADYHERRRVWADEIGRPYPQRRTSKRKPIPGVIDVDAEDDG